MRISDWSSDVCSSDLLIAPLVVNAYILSILILVLYFAYTGQAWNVMMGFAGQLSLGHSLYVGVGAYAAAAVYVRSEEHTSELQSLMRISYAVFCLKKNNNYQITT